MVSGTKELLETGKKNLPQNNDVEFLNSLSSYIEKCGYDKRTKLPELINALSQLSQFNQETYLFFKQITQSSNDLKNFFIHCPKKTVEIFSYFSKLTEPFEKDFFTILKNNLQMFSDFLSIGLIIPIQKETIEKFIVHLISDSNTASEIIEKNIKIKLKKDPNFISKIPNCILIGIIFSIRDFGYINFDFELEKNLLIEASNRNLDSVSITQKYGLSGKFFISYFSKVIASGMAPEISMTESNLFRNSLLIFGNALPSDQKNTIEAIKRLSQINEYSKNLPLDKEDRKKLSSVISEAFIEKNFTNEILTNIILILNQKSRKVSESLSHLRTFIDLVRKNGRNEPTLALGLFLMYDQAVSVVKKAGLDPNDPINYLNFAYGLCVLGSEEKVLRLNRDWGIIHFMRYSAKKILKADSILDGKPTTSIHLIISANNDHNRALYRSRLELPDTEEDSLIAEVGSVQDFISKIQKASKIGLINRLTANMHGTEDSLQLGWNLKLNSSAWLTSLDPKLSRVSNCFEKNALIILDACLNGSITPDGLAIQLSKIWKKTFVFAAREKVYKTKYFDKPPFGKVPIFYSTKGAEGTIFRNGHPKYRYSLNDKKIVFKREKGLIPKKSN